MDKSPIDEECLVSHLQISFRNILGINLTIYRKKSGNSLWSYRLYHFEDHPLCLEFIIPIANVFLQFHLFSLFARCFNKREQDNT
jgi:hypothetical protein